MLNVVSNYSTNLMFRDHLNLNNLTLKYPKYTFFEVSGYLTPNPLPIQNILFSADLHELEQLKKICVKITQRGALLFETKKLNPYTGTP